jgi:hypothetical protein
VVAADLFVAQRPVADEGSDTRNQALSRMLSDILVRVSGSTRVTTQPGSQVVLDAAPSLVQQYRYESSAGEEGITKTLWARFDGASVERMMRQNGLPVWRQRPRVLLWLATERGSQRELLNLESQPEAQAALMARAQYRGLPLQLPLMDLTDQASLTPADVWSDYRAGIAQASDRYPHDLVLTGRLSSSDAGAWRGNWQLYQGENSQPFTTPAGDLSTTLAAAVDRTQDLLAARYAPLSSGNASSGTLLRVAGVNDLPAYGQLVALLRELSPVSSVALRHVDGDALWFELGLRGDTTDLRRALDATAQVVLDPAGAPAPRMPVAPDAALKMPAPDADLYYRLNN